MLSSSENDLYLEIKDDGIVTDDKVGTGTAYLAKCRQYGSEVQQVSSRNDLQICVNIVFECDSREVVCSSCSAFPPIAPDIFPGVYCLRDSLEVGDFNANPWSISILDQVQMIYHDKPEGFVQLELKFERNQVWMPACPG